MRDGLPWSSLRGKADISYFHVLVLNRRMRIRTFGGVGGVSMLPLPDYARSYYCHNLYSMKCGSFYPECNDAMALSLNSISPFFKVSIFSCLLFLL